MKSPLTDGPDAKRARLSHDLSSLGKSSLGGLRPTAWIIDQPFLLLFTATASFFFFRLESICDCHFDARPFFPFATTPNTKGLTDHLQKRKQLQPPTWVVRGLPTLLEKTKQISVD